MCENSIVNALELGSSLQPRHCMLLYPHWLECKVRLQAERRIGVVEGPSGRAQVHFVGTTPLQVGCPVLERAWFLPVGAGTHSPQLGFCLWAWRDACGLDMFPCSLGWRAVWRQQGGRTGWAEALFCVYRSNVQRRKGDCRGWQSGRDTRRKRREKEETAERQAVSNRGWDRGAKPVHGWKSKSWTTEQPGHTDYVTSSQLACNDALVGRAPANTVGRSQLSLTGGRGSRHSQPLADIVGAQPSCLARRQWVSQSNWIRHWPEAGTAVTVSPWQALCSGQPPARIISVPSQMAAVGLSRHCGQHTQLPQLGESVAWRKQALAGSQAETWKGMSSRQQSNVCRRSEGKEVAAPAASTAKLLESAGYLQVHPRVA